MLVILLTWDRLQVDLHATVLCPAVGVGVAGDRLVRAHATYRNARSIHTLRSQVGADRLRAALGQVHVVLTAAGAVGEADHFDGVLVELLERASQVVQRRVEAWRDVGRVGGEGDVAWHDQLDLVALALHLDAGIGHLCAQCGFLLVGVVAVTGCCGTHCGCADQCTFTPVVVVDGGTGDSAGQRAQAAVLGGLAHPRGALRLTLVVVRVLACAASHQGCSGCDDNQTTHGEHGQAPTEIHKCGRPRMDLCQPWIAKRQKNSMNTFSRRFMPARTGSRASRHPGGCLARGL